MMLQPLQVCEWCVPHHAAAHNKLQRRPARLSAGVEHCAVVEGSGIIHRHEVALLSCCSGMGLHGSRPEAKGYPAHCWHSCCCTPAVIGRVSMNQLFSKVLTIAMLRIASSADQMIAVLTAAVASATAAVL